MKCNSCFQAEAETDSRYRGKCHRCWSALQEKYDEEVRQSQAEDNPDPFEPE